MVAEIPEQGAGVYLGQADAEFGSLSARIAELKKRDVHIVLDARVQGIQFLRGVASRASFVLPAYYEQLGASVVLHQEVATYSRRVQAANAEFISVAAISLICRSIFDDATSGLTGKAFAKASTEAVSSIGRFWSEKSQKPKSDTSRALELLRRVFQRCARRRNLLLDSTSLLERRIGLLKYHADRQAAHISLEPYLFHLLDLIHVVAAITVIGAIIVEFDDPRRGTRYFDDIDSAAWEAAKRTFPDLPGDRLFSRFNIHEQGRLYWESEGVDGLDMLLNQLPVAIGC